jgi:hypothetical protein
LERLLFNDIAIANGQIDKVIDCSSGNDKKFHDSIKETGPEIFSRADTIWGKFAE